MLQDPQVDPDSDPEDDPGKLLNVWLGELDNLKKGLNSPPTSPSKDYGVPRFSGAIQHQAPVMRRKNNHNSLQVNDSTTKTQYRCSLINLEECTQDDELDAILGELSVLESKFDEEIADQKQQQHQHQQQHQSTNIGQERDLKKDASPVDSEGSDRSSGMHSRSSSGSVDVKKETEQRKQNNEPNKLPVSQQNGGKRTESPDNDSAFCDNLSVLSSCSASSLHTPGGTGTPAGNNPSPIELTPEEQEARVKAEKIKLALEKIREANIKKLFIKVFTADGSAKSLLVDEKMTVGHVTRILAEKNHVRLDPKWALVELIPDLYMERVYEDSENLVENCLMWKMDSKNTLWFIERPEKFDVFRRPELYLLGSSSSQSGNSMEDHARQELIEEYFSSSGVGAPEVDGFVWLKSDNKKSWKKFYFVLRSSGLYYAPKGKKTSKDLVCLATFDVNQVYYGAGWKKKYKAPTDFCFAIKHPQIQVKTPKYIRYLCVDTERELHQWVTGIRVAKNGRHLFENYRGIEEEITHADIDILTSKRFSGLNSVMPPNTLAICSNLASDSAESKSPARTPSSENKSFDSALSSGRASEIYASSASQGSGTNRNSSASSSTSYNIIMPASVAAAAAAAAASAGAGNDCLKANNDITPVNTLDRSGSVCPSTSSSSGCLSDRSSSGSFQHSHASTSELHGFESDFPAGGTIKKRPSMNPRIPLTTTTWGLVGGSNSDNEDNDSLSAANVRVGGGGTLLRHSLRRKNSRDDQQQQQQQGTLGRQHRVYAQVHREPNVSGVVIVQPPQAPVMMTNVHNVVDQLSAEFETSLNGVQEMDCENESYEEEEIPLPPPPRAESMDLGALVSPTALPAANFNAMTTSTNDIDDLPPPPPPPPELSGGPAENPYYVSPVLHSPPALPPPSLLKPLKANRPTVGNTKKISFNDNVQLIGVSSPMEDDDEEAYEPWCPKNIVTEMPKKLPPPPVDFLQDLQRVMTKKWQIAERCRGEETSPHQVLGFRDVDIKNLVGTGYQYSRDDTVGAWVLQAQKYNVGMQQQHQQQQQQHQQQQQQQQQQHYQQQQPVLSNGYHHHKEPLYAVSTKSHPPQHYQTHSVNGRISSPLPPPPPQHQQQHVSYPQQQQHQARVLPPLPPSHQQRPPVVLREPTPEYDPYSMHHATTGYNNNNKNFQMQPQSYSPSPVASHHSEVSNYSTLMYSPEPALSSSSSPSSFVGANGTGYYSPSPTHQNYQSFNRASPSTSSLNKRAPPPPRRSETTHLSTTASS